MLINQEEWAAIAQATGGTVKDGGRFLQEPWVEVPVRSRGNDEPGTWTVTLDKYTTVVPVGKVMVPIQFARARAPFLSRDNLRLTIYRANLFSGVATFFGSQDVEIGDREFDKTFIVKASEPEQALRLLNGEPGQRLRKLLEQVPDVHLSIIDDGRRYGAGDRLPEGTDLIHVYSASAKLHRDAKVMAELVAETLRGLVRIGSAHEEAL